MSTTSTANGGKGTIMSDPGSGDIDEVVEAVALESGRPVTAIELEVDDGRACPKWRLEVGGFRWPRRRRRVTIDNYSGQWRVASWGETGSRPQLFVDGFMTERARRWLGLGPSRAPRVIRSGGHGR
jgi:hypothetical protein